MCVRAIIYNIRIAAHFRPTNNRSYVAIILITSPFAGICDRLQCTSLAVNNKKQNKDGISKGVESVTANKDSLTSSLGIIGTCAYGAIEHH